MGTYFPNTIWDGDSSNRNSDKGILAAPDYRDWQQITKEIIAIQDYILNSNINLGTRYLYIGPTPEASIHYNSSIIYVNLAESGTNILRIGDGTNHIQFDTNGAMTLFGTAKRKLTIRPKMDSITQVAHSKSAQVSVGVFKGYSCPIYNNDNQEIFYETRVPYRWDGESDILICMTVALAGAEDIGDTFKFRCSWEHVGKDGILGSSSNDVDTEVTIITGHTAQHSIYHVHFIIDYDIDGVGNEIAYDDVLGFRIRRIASSGTEVDNNIIVFNEVLDFQINKIFHDWTRP